MHIKKFIKLVLHEDAGTPSFTADPTQHEEIPVLDQQDNAADWWAGPGKPAGTSGDPGRPEDANSYLGLVPISLDVSTSTE